MLNSWLDSLSEANIISIVLLVVVLFSVLQGWGRGFKGRPEGCSDCSAPE